MSFNFQLEYAFPRATWERGKLSNGKGGFTDKYVMTLPTEFNKVNRANETSKNIKIADFDGDGLPDIYLVLNGADKIYINNGNKTFSHKYSPNVLANKDQIKFVDLNGDGAVDIYDASGDKGYAWINNGKGVLSKNSTPIFTGSAKSKNIKFIDINGDGYQDIFRIEDRYSPITSSIYLNKGNATFKFLNRPDIHQKDYNVDFTDINGDGFTDIIERTGARSIWINQAKKPLLTRITNGADQDIKIAYKPMTDPGVYYNYSTHGKRNAYTFNKIANDNIEITTTQPLVYTVDNSNGVGGYNKVRYRYHGFVINKLRGSQGFYYVITYDYSRKEASGTLYKQIDKSNGENFQYTGMPYMSYSGREFGAAWNEWLERTDLSYKDASKRSNIYEPYTFSNKESVYDPESKKHISSIYHFNTLSDDGLGNVLTMVDRVEDIINGKNFYKLHNNRYDVENKEKWHIGRLTKAIVNHALNTKGESTFSNVVARSSTFKYNSKGVLSEEVANAGTTLALKKTYVYDAKGNKTSETVSGTGVITATTTFGYSPDYKFQTSVTNAVGLTETRAYDAKFGTLTSLTGPNGLKTTWTYDGMGRKTKETRADGTWHKWEHKWYKTANIKSRYLYYVRETQSGTSYNTATYYDSLGRETSKHTSTLGSKRILRYKYYNAKGELYAETLPYINGQDTKTYIRSYYDKYGRATKVTKPGPNGSTQTYSTVNKNFTSTTTNPKGQRKQTIQNAIGQTLKITDAYGSSIASSIDYKYDAAGNLRFTTDSASNQIEMRYDAAGNKYYMNDPDLGIWNYRYFPTGKLRYQWSGTEGTAGSKNFTYKTYDVLGRLIQTNTYDKPSHTNNSATYTFNYKTFKYGDASAAVGTRGKLTEAYTSSRIGGNDYQREKKIMTYDALGRAVSTNNYIYGRGSHVVSTTYDAYSRPNTITYPNGYKITNHYNNGILDYVKGSDGKVHYKINALTAFGEVASSTFANGVVTAVGHDSAGFVGSILSGQNGSHYTGNVQQVRYTYDGLGNVLTRNDDSVVGKYIRDTFTYDAMNRLLYVRTNSSVIGDYSRTRQYRYDQLGNITYQSGIGKYSYYDDKPHALKNISNFQFFSVPQPGDSSETIRNYTYDDVGNMTHRNGDIITYNPLSKPAILKNKNGKEVRFYYGIGGQRFMKTTAEKQTFYLGKGYEEEQVVGSKEVKSTVYITVGGKTVGTHVEVLDKDYVVGNPKHKVTYNRYFHTDALGSITAITDDAGTVVERRSYEPFGKIRAMDYGLTSNNAIIPANTVTQTARAYTGHEQIAELSGLIHMNARVYDSDIGRFLSADTIIQAPHDSQSYNRYSYVRNNPLMFTDPSGHSWFSKLWKKVKKYIRTIASIIVAAVIVIATSGTGLFAVGWGGFFGAGAGIATGALAGFASGLIMTGSLKGALKGALFGAIGAGLATGIGHGIGLEGAGNLFAKGVNVGKLFIKSALHGLSRGIISMAQGGTFKSGFASGFTSSFFSPGTTGKGGFLGRTSIAAIVGGTASSIGGGKFSNGAVSGAFVHMFNDENLVKDWITGSGSKMRVYGPSNSMTKDLSTDSTIIYFKDKFLTKYNLIGDAKYYPVEFGWSGFFFANTSTLADIGSYGLSIYRTGQNELTYVISNDMGVSSLTAHIFSDNNSGAMATIETWFWWKGSVR